MRLHQAAASLGIAALLSAAGAFADVRGVRFPPSFTAQEIDLISKDERLLGAAKRCAQQLRQALDALNETSLGSRVGVAPLPCPAASGSPGRASDEGALDILKDISEQGTGRSGGGDLADGGAGSTSPTFTSDELDLIRKNKNLIYATRHCAWQLRRALDSLHYGARDWPPQRPCPLRPLGDSTRGSDEGALDILKILREASGESKN